MVDIIQDSLVNFRVKSKTRDLYHYVNIEKNKCSCESKLYRGLYKKDKTYQCEHIKRVLKNEIEKVIEKQTVFQNETK